MEFYTVETKVSDLEKLEELILEYRKEKEQKKKRILYLNLIQESLKLVKKIAMGMYPIPNNIPKEDLVQVGAVGVLRAIETYQVEERGSFKTYVSKFIKGEILHYLRDKANLVKTPRETLANMSRVKEAIDELSSGKNIPTADEIASYTNLPINKVEEIMNIELIKNMVSLDQNVYSIDGTETLLDRIQAEDSNSYQESYENKKIIEFALKKLPEPDKTVISLYYMEGEQRKSIAKRLHVSPTQISRILRRALNKLYVIIENEMNDKIKT